MGIFFAPRTHYAHHWMFMAIATLVAGSAGYAVYMNFSLPFYLQMGGVLLLAAAWVLCWYQLRTAAVVLLSSVLVLQAVASAVYGPGIFPLFLILDAALAILLWKKVGEK